MTDNNAVANGERILIVDDDPMSVKLIRALLTGAGHLVRSAKSAEEALTVLEAFDAGLILIDLQLPGVNGLELASQLRGRPAMQKTSIIALTAYAMTGDEQKVRNAGCDGFITKPIDARTLPSVVSKFLKEERSHDGISSREPLNEPDNGPARNARDSAVALASEPFLNHEGEEVAPSLLQQPASGDNEDLLAELRNNLLAQGMDELPKLLASLETAFSVDRARRFFHRWAGIAGTLGYPEITLKARKLEELLPYPVIETKETLRAGMQELMACFSATAFARKADRVWPPEIVACLSGKRFGLIGFSRAETQRMDGALQQIQVSTKAFAKATPGAGILSIFDLLVVKLTATDADVWTDPDQLGNNLKPLLLVGPCEALVRANVLRPQPDFLATPWDTDEVILRTYRLLSKSRASRRAASRRPGSPMPVVVIADDDIAITRLVSASLQKCQIDCRVASDGAQALQMVKDLRPSALILDINMPGMDGFDVLMRMRMDAQARNIPVILLTARRQEDDVMRGFGYGASDYIIKPFNTNELAARVTRLIE